MELEYGGGKDSDHRSRQPVIFSVKIVIEKTLYFVALVSTCFVLCTTFPPNQYNISLTNNPFLSTDPGSDHYPNTNGTSTISTFQSSSPILSQHSPAEDDHIGSSILPPNGPSTSTTTALVSFNLSSPPMNNIAPNDSLLPANSPPAANDSLPEHAPTDNVSNNSSILPLAAPENLPSPVTANDEEDKLKKILSEAAMEDKTVIVTAINAAWAAPNALFDVLLESFKIGMETQKFLDNLVVVALDQKAYARCLELHSHCFALTTEGFDFSTGQVFFNTPNYMKLVWRKVEFMEMVLKLGYNSIFTDADMLWLRDPFPQFYLDADIQISCDHYEGTPTNGKVNTGFYYVKSNMKTIKFFEFWLASRDKTPSEHDQKVFNRIRSDPFVQEIGLSIKLLDTIYYEGFCEPNHNLNLVRTVHTNCCYGLDNKVHDLKMLTEIWKQYMTLPVDERLKQPQTWAISPRMCG